MDTRTGDCGKCEALAQLQTKFDASLVVTESLRKQVADISMKWSLQG